MKSADFKPWSQYACDQAHTSVAQDVWDHNKFDKEAWSMTLRGLQGWARNPVIDKGLLAIGDGDNVYCKDVISGKTVWIREMTETISGSCAILDDVVIVPTKTRVLGLALSTGEIKWYNNNAGQNISSPTFVKDDKGGRFFYFTSSQVSGLAYKYNLDTGRVVWEHKTEMACPGAIGVNTSEGAAGVAAHFKVDLVSDLFGGVGQSYETSTQVFGATMAFGPYCVFTMASGEVILLPKPYGAKDAQIIDVGAWTFWPPALYQETMIIGNDHGRLVRFDQLGKVVWEKTMPGPVTNGCTIMGDLVLVPVGSDGKDTAGVYIVKAEDGETVKRLPLSAKHVFQPVVAWGRMFVEHGENVDFKKRTLTCFGKPPRNPEEEPKLRIDGGKMTVEVPYKGETTRQVTLINEGKVPLELYFSQDIYMEPTVAKVNLGQGEKDTLRVKIRAGGFRPGKYQGQLYVLISDPDYGERQLGTITASITITEKAPEQPKEEPPLPPTNLQVRWIADHVELSWEKPATGTDVVGYNLFKTIGEEPYPKIPVNSNRLTETVFSDIEVREGWTYRYRVVAVGKNSLLSDPSEEASVKIPIRLASVKNLRAEVQGGMVKLSWESGQPVEFRIERNGDLIGSTSDLIFTDPSPPKERLIYKVFPVFESKIGPEAFVVVDLTPPGQEPPPPNPPLPPTPPPAKKTVVVFTVAKDVAQVDGLFESINGAPYLNAGRMMVPFRFLGEKIGAKVTFTTDPNTGRVETVQYLLDNKLITLTIGSKLAKVGDKEVALDVAPEIKLGRTYVPLRFVTEVLGGGVSWDSATRSAAITYPP